MGAGVRKGNIKMSKITLENGITVTGATLLTVEEAKRLPKSILKIDYPWWLRSPGNYANLAAYVYSYGSVSYYGYDVDDYVSGVRPALNIHLESPIPLVGSRFVFGDKGFEIISESQALCTGIVDECVFRKDRTADDANDYEASDVKKFVDAWYKKCLELEQKRCNIPNIGSTMDASFLEEALREARYFAKDVRKYLYEIEQQRPLTDTEKALWEKTHDVHIHTNDAEMMLQGEEKKSQQESSAMVTISTAHITPKLAGHMETGEVMDGEIGIPCYAKGDYGYFIPITDYLPEHPILKDLFTYAKENHYDWLCLDQDGPVLDSLPTYDWEEERELE